MIAPAFQGSEFVNPIITTWIVGGLVAIVGLAGLFVASRATDGIMYGTGLVFFAFGALFCFDLIRRGTDD